MAHIRAIRGRTILVGKALAGSTAHVNRAKPEHPAPGYRLSLLGSFQLAGPDGQRIEITSKKAIALLGLLSTTATGERWRSWIQERLWGSLEPQQAQAGLRRELHRLRKLTEIYDIPLLISDFRSIRLNLPFVRVDIRHPNGIRANSGELLEGIDIPGEEAFEDWLREMRNNLFDTALEIRTDYILANSTRSLRAAAGRGFMEGM